MQGAGGGCTKQAARATGPALCRAKGVLVSHLSIRVPYRSTSLSSFAEHWVPLTEAFAVLLVWVSTASMAPRPLDVNTRAGSLFQGTLITWPTFLSWKEGCWFKSIWNVPEQYMCLSVFVLRVLKISSPRNSIFLQQLCVQTTVCWAWVGSVYPDQRSAATTAAFTKREWPAGRHLRESMTWETSAGVLRVHPLVRQRFLVFLGDGW